MTISPLHCVLAHNRLQSRETKMTPEEFFKKLRTRAATFGKAVAMNEGEWIIKSFIAVYRRTYTIP